jgi:Flp pilus assembly CpaF family ATPase
MSGFDLILPFLRPIAGLIQDPSISDIMINGDRRVWIERRGRIEEVPDAAIDPKSLRVALQNIARLLGDDFSEEKPMAAASPRRFRRVRSTESQSRSASSAAASTRRPSW